MEKTRQVNTRFWSDSFIVELNPLDRYFFLYLLTNEHTKISGIYELSWRVMARETGLEDEMLQKMLKRLSGKVYWIDGWIILRNFIKNQKIKDGRNNVVTGILNELIKIPIDILIKIRKIPELQKLIKEIIDDFGKFEFNQKDKLTYETLVNSIRDSKGLQGASRDSKELPLSKSKSKSKSKSESESESEFKEPPYGGVAGASPSAPSAPHDLPRPDIGEASKDLGGAYQEHDGVEHGGDKSLDLGDGDESARLDKNGKNKSGKKIVKKAPKGGDPQINECLKFLKEHIGSHLDESELTNRRYCYLLINEFKKNYEKEDPVMLIKMIIVEGIKSDPYLGRNITNFKYLYYNASKIIQSVKMGDKLKGNNRKALIIRDI